MPTDQQLVENMGIAEKGGYASLNRRPCTQVERRRSLAAVFAALLISFASLGCDDRATSKNPAPTTLPPPARVDHPAKIDGTVTFAGPAPQLPRLIVAGDDKCVKAHPDGVADESVVIGAGGALANTLVYLSDGPKSDGAGREPALIDQIDCQYVPHVVAVQVNQPLRVRSSDPCMHNVHVMGTRNTALNFAEIQPSEQTVHFAEPEIMKARCDVHPWMKAVIGVFDTPYFAVSGPDGKFAISNVPPGAYTLTAWHERFGEKSQKITVAPDASVHADFTYAP